MVLNGLSASKACRLGRVAASDIRRDMTARKAKKDGTPTAARKTSVETRNK